MSPSKSVANNLDSLNKIVQDLKDVSEEISEENIAILLLNLLNSLPKSFGDVKVTIKHGHEKFTLSDIKYALRTKNFDLRKENKINGENIYVKSRSDKKDFNRHKDMI